MSALALVFVILMQLPGGGYPRHLREHALPVPQRIQQLTEYTEAAADYAQLKPWVVGALFKMESNMDPSAKSKLGARGMGQLFHANPQWKPWRRVCYRVPRECDRAGAIFAARALKVYLIQCRSLAQAYTAYRVGHCQRPGPLGLETLALARKMERMVHSEIHKALLPMRLP